MNYVPKLSALNMISGAFLGALNAAEIGLQVPQPKDERFETSASSVYTPQNGYFGDLTLLANDGSSTAAEAQSRTLVARLSALLAEQKAMRVRLTEIDAASGDVRVQRESILRRQEEIGRMLDQVVSLIKQGAAKPPSLPTRTSTRIPEAKSREVPRFSGYITNGSERWFALSLPTVDATKERNEWLTVGQKIGAFEIRDFDFQQEVLSLLRSDGERIELRIADSTVNDSPEQLKRRWRNLIDTSPRAIRDLYQPDPAPGYPRDLSPTRR